MALPINNSKVAQSEEQRELKALKEQVKALEAKIEALQPKPSVEGQK